MIDVCKVMRFPAWQLHVLPPDTPWTLAVLAEPLATACKAVRLVAWLKSAAAESVVRTLTFGNYLYHETLR